mmetsp:Transcript_29593/g.74270  ORF Transcript_29593/g.74270 Transcript_29593/m.74270 type:complete len:292 (+) Transcript_29593:133-1008(+)
MATPTTVTPGLRAASSSLAAPRPLTSAAFLPRRSVVSPCRLGSVRRRRGIGNAAIKKEADLETSTPDYLRPERLALATAWAGFFGFAAVVAPHGDAVNAFDLDFVKTLIGQPFKGAVNPVAEAQFNMLGVMPAVYASLLLPGAKDQKPLPAAPFVVSAFALGYGALGPYLVARQQRDEPVARSQLGWYTRTVAESKINALALAGFAAFLIYYGSTNLSAATLAEYQDIWATKSALVAASSIDLAILSLVVINPMREDCRRRGWDASAALPFCLIPVLGPALYLLFRPQLPK